MKLRLDTTITYDIFRLLERIYEGNADYSFLINNRFLSSYKISELIDLLDELEWIKIDKTISLTEKILTFLSKHIKNEEQPYELKYLLENYILHIKPSWIYMIPSGREELKPYLSQDEFRVFLEAGLYYDYSEETITWWDNISKNIRNIFSDKKMISGREGERMTITYELKRTGYMPKYKAIDSNKLGYDVCSIVSSDNKRDLYIESKCISGSINSFYVTRNEWEVARNKDNYLFYIWKRKDSAKLVKLTPNDLKQHIPENIGSGRWTEIEIQTDGFIDESKWMEVDNDE